MYSLVLCYFTVLPQWREVRDSSLRYLWWMYLNPPDISQTRFPSCLLTITYDKLSSTLGQQHESHFDLENPYLKDFWHNWTTILDKWRSTIFGNYWLCPPSVSKYMKVDKTSLFLYSGSPIQFYILNLYDISEIRCCQNAD